MIFRDKYQEQEGVLIVRILVQLGAIGKVIYHQLGPRVRNPEGVWCWLGKKRNDLKELAIRLTNREIYNYVKGRIVVKSHKSDRIIRMHCLTVEFM